ncbi:glycoside hydrolase family 10 protein [Bradymonas sediminis]|uniref:Uncharacterized protein n=1 Tax=Bradymonas sediminis TaxID=1548548 RepID=A0A2Z4FMD2_9DELT|nr:family 10 glycosylhydrolase [Bradymonas sediminis]AWV90092.1 hypothetical protein DN745_12410 [Bradymonas sediminis]TDP75938.1 uncharacterized lipoprotein YddW (UPF0748 family) [Bradymonas sediminis]
MNKFIIAPLILALSLSVSCVSDEVNDPDEYNTSDATADTREEDAGSDAQQGEPDSDTANEDAGAQVDASPDEDSTPTPVEGVEVSHAREVRGVWIPTVFNISWPSRSGLSVSAQKAELTAQLDVVKNAGLNTVYFQVRAEADAFYDSDIEPWSRFLTGTMGQDPGWDPLEFAVEEAHKRGLELHAWLNPYRALASGNSSLASANHITRTRPDLVHFYNNLYWIDPGLFDGQAQTVNVIHDILARYDIDGIHFDDYFYPYPDGPFPDSATYDAYLANGGTLSLGDFRRNNVHELVETVHQLIQQERPDVRYGISPFGIYRPGIPEGITGLDQYAEIYADPLHWLEQGWVDYIAPQLYWPTTQTAQAYGVLLNWWADQAKTAGKDLYIGNYTAKLGTSSDWTVAEFLEQIRLTRQARERGAMGNIHYQINPLQENRSGFTTAMRQQFYTRPAAAPPIAGATGRPPMPELTVSDAGVRYEGSDDIRYFAVYRDHELIQLVPGVQQQFGLAIGEYLISAIDRRDRESLGVPITITVDSAPPIDDPEEPAAGSCTHSFGGVYADGACSGSYQCCNGSWESGQNSCGTCTCVETTGQQGCSP